MGNKIYMADYDISAATTGTIIKNPKLICQVFQLAQIGDDNFSFFDFY